MTISYIGQATGTTTATIPAHQTGDLIVAFAFRDGSTTAASLPAGWTNIRNEGANLCAGRLAYKIAASSSETSGTWTSATTLIIQVYRATRTISVGANNSNTGSATTVNYPALTLQNPRSWVCAFAGHASTNTTLESPPSGMTLRATSVDATDEGAGFDTNGYVNSWASTNVAVGGTSAGYRSYVLEIKEAAQVGAATLNATAAASYGGSASRLGSSSLTATGAALFTGSQPSVNIATRITESGDRRVTEAGDVRVVPVQAEGEVSLVGIDGVNTRITENGNRRITEDGRVRLSQVNAFTATLTAAGLAAFSGAGTATFRGTSIMGSAALSGAGSISATSTRGRSASFSLSGAGTASFASTKTARPNVALAGAGTATFNGKRTGRGVVSLLGAGSAAFNGRYTIKAAANMAGAGIASFNGQRTRSGAFSLSGAGTAVFNGEAVITVDNVDIRLGGVWYGKADTFVKVSGTWKQVIKIYAHDDGVWKITR